MQQQCNYKHTRLFSLRDRGSSYTKFFTRVLTATKRLNWHITVDDTKKKHSVYILELGQQTNELSPLPNVISFISKSLQPNSFIFLRVDEDCNNTAGLVAQLQDFLVWSVSKEIEPSQPVFN